MNSGIQQAQLHPQCNVEEGAKIGSGTRVWAYAHILSGAVVGSDCNICDHTFIEGGVTVGDRVTIKCGVYLWDGVILEDEVFVGPNATFTNDMMPRSKQTPASYLPTTVAKGASIGANATILPGLRIGEKAMVGAGAVVTRDVPPNAIVAGNPARIIGYAGTTAYNANQRTESSGIQTSSTTGVTLCAIRSVKDMRGDLSAAEYEKDLPFLPKRAFLVYNVPSAYVRGEHAHLECHQFLLCVKGTLSVVVDDGNNREEFLLNSPLFGLHVPPKIWATQYKYSADAVLLVFASHPYDASDYVRDYGEFLKLRGIESAS